MAGKTVFDLLDETPVQAQPKSSAKTVFDLVEYIPPAAQSSSPAEISSAPSPTATPSPSSAPTASTAQITGISAAPGEFTSLLKSPIEAIRQAISEQYQQGTEAIDFKNHPIRSALGVLQAATAPLAPIYNPIQNVITTVLAHLMQSEPGARGGQVPGLDQAEIAQRDKENVRNLANIAGTDRPTTGSQAGDIVAGLVAGAVPLPIPVKTITKLLGLSEKLAPEVEAVASELVKRGVPNEEKALATEIAKVVTEKPAVSEAVPAAAAQVEKGGTQLKATPEIVPPEFAQQAGEAQAAQRQAARNEVAQNVLNAPEGKVSKRTILGMKTPGAGEVSGPLFGEKPQDLFTGTGGRVSKYGQQVPPPAVSEAKPFRLGKPTPAPTGSVLSEVERITQTPPPKPPTFMENLRAAQKKVQTSVVSEFTPVRDLERKLYEGAQKPVPVVDLARKFEQVAGAPARAEADLIDFRKAVVDPIRDIPDDFNSYLFLKRTEDRLLHNPEVKRVGDWTVEKARAGLAELHAKLGDENMTRLEVAGQAYQKEMDKAIQLQVASGRMSQEVYDRIHASSDFYARFKVMKYFEDLEQAPAGTGRKIATTSDLTKAISGIDAADLQIGNILQASAEQIVKSRILAEKNLKMLELDKLVALDPEGELIKRVQPTRYYKIEYKPAEQILSQLGLQQTAKNPQVLEQSFIKVGKAIQYADEVGLKVKQRNMTALGRATLGGVESGGRVNLKAFTSETIAHELGHSFDTILRDMNGNPVVETRNVFGVVRDVPQRVSGDINLGPTGKRTFGKNPFQKELADLVNYTGLGGSEKYRASAKERFAEFLQLYIHNPGKARELAPTWTDHFETKILPTQKVKDLVEKLSKFYQKVDKLPNILTPLKDLDDANYLELAIRRAFPERDPKIGVIFGTKARTGFQILKRNRDQLELTYLKDGKPVALEVRKDLAGPLEDAIQGLNGAQTGLIAKVLLMGKVPLQWGATSANSAFQVVNLLFADLPRAALVSRYGVRSIRDIYQFPLDWAYSLFTSMKGNFGHPNELFMDWLRSGAANSTIQREITPEAFKPTLGLLQPWNAKRVLSLPKEAILDNVAKFSNAIEETSKILGLKRGIRVEGRSPEAIEKIATEVRNYSGSPDFARKGNQTTNLNLLFMFFNARMQGAAADIARLAGKTGTKEAAAAWARIGTTVGIPATILALVNQSDKNRADYEQVPEWERQNYFMIPRDSYFYNDTGEKVRDYWRIPKREIVSVFANMIEDAVKFGADKDPSAFKTFATDALETLSPLNVQGQGNDVFQMQRLESVIGSANPLLKTPIEIALNRDTFRHQAIIPDYMKNAPPEEQYRNTTPKEFVAAGKKMGVSPLRLENIAQSVTGGGLSQFSLGKAQPGRGEYTQYPVVKRFVRSGSLAGEDQQAAITASETKETGAQLQRRRAALDLLQEWQRSKLSPQERQKKIQEIRKTDPQLAAKVFDLNKDQMAGITYMDRQVEGLGVKSGARAEFIAGQMAKMKSDLERQVYIQNLKKKKLLSPEVERQLGRLKRAG